MKKAIAIVLAGLLLITLCACGKQDNGDKKDTNTTTQPVGETTASVPTQIIYAPDEEGNLTSQVIILTTEAPTTTSTQAVEEAPSATESITTPVTGATETTATTKAEPTVGTTKVTESVTESTTTAPVNTTVTTTPVTGATETTTTTTEAESTTTTTEWVIEDEDDGLFNDAELGW